MTEISFIAWAHVARKRLYSLSTSLQEPGCPFSGEHLSTNRATIYPVRGACRIACRELRVDADGVNLMQFR